MLHQIGYCCALFGGIFRFFSSPLIILYMAQDNLIWMINVSLLFLCLFLFDLLNLENALPGGARPHAVGAKLCPTFLHLCSFLTRRIAPAR